MNIKIVNMPSGPLKASNLAIARITIVYLVSCF